MSGQCPERLTDLAHRRRGVQCFLFWRPRKHKSNVKIPAILVHYVSAHVQRSYHKLSACACIQTAQCHTATPEIYTHAHSSMPYRRERALLPNIGGKMTAAWFSSILVSPPSWAPEMSLSQIRDAHAAPECSFCFTAFAVRGGPLYHAYCTMAY